MSDRAFAVLGLFDTPDALLSAIPRVRARDLGRLEAYTPYPVHGLEKALGLKKSPLAGMVLVMGLLGALSAFLFQFWATGIDYPTVVGGKSPLAWQAYIPIVFEVMVLFATFTAGLGMLLLLNRLPFYGHPVLASRSIAAVTRDRFALSVEAAGAELDVEAAARALREAGASAVEVVLVPPEAGPYSPNALLRGLLSVAAACLVAGLATYWGIKLMPVLPPMVHMEDQPRVNAQAPSAFFPDGHAMRLPAPGAVARGYLPYGPASPEEAAALPNPLPRDARVLALGRSKYETFCAVCHGPLGDGVPTLTSAYGAKPANLQSRTVREYPDGVIFHVITRGKNAMPGYAWALTEEERWAVVHYVRVLERAQNARDEDLK